jgi:hypothetical protein
LLLNGLLDDVQWRTAAAQDAIAAAPKHRLVVKACEMVCVFVATPATRARLECVHKISQCRRRHKSEQQMNMIGFAVHFDQRAKPPVYLMALTRMLGATTPS